MSSKKLNMKTLYAALTYISGTPITMVAVLRRLWGIPIRSSKLVIIFTDRVSNDSEGNIAESLSTVRELPAIVPVMPVALLITLICVMVALYVAPTFVP